MILNRLALIGAAPLLCLAAVHQFGGMVFQQAPVETVLTVPVDQAVIWADPPLGSPRQLHGAVRITFHTRWNGEGSMEVGVQLEPSPLDLTWNRYFPGARLVGLAKGSGTVPIGVPVALSAGVLESAGGIYAAVFFAVDPRGQVELFHVAFQQVLDEPVPMEL